ncbi:MAG: HlyD family efflux transporter periplasmic adaptor subunit [Xanthomonadaceae bacterium]|nr:HlyD family efflux transporter periplasmic adaptor subunit [Xanthomonadaceae bacterium]
MAEEQEHAAEQEQPAQDPGKNDEKSPDRRKLILAGLVAVLVLGGLLWLGYWLVYGRWHASTDDAYVKGNIVTVTPQVSGTVVAITTDDTDYVRRGQVLVRLDATDANAALARAEANLAQTVRQVRQLYANVVQLEAQIDAENVTLAQARRDYDRNRGLRKVNGVSEEALQHSQTAYRADSARLAATRAQLQASEAAVQGTTLANHPLVKQAEARMRDAWLALARACIVAPTDGFIANRNVQLGERIAPGQALMAVVPLNDVWVDANFKETDLDHVRIGQPVKLTSDLYGSDVTYKGHVVGLDPGTGGVFALLPPQNATGNWIKVVQRLPVRIALDHGQLQKHPLQLGLSMNVDVDTNDRSGRRLARTPAAGAGQATTVYAAESRGLDAAIARIVAANAGSATATASGVGQ